MLRNYLLCETKIVQWRVNVGNECSDFIKAESYFIVENNKCIYCDAIVVCFVRDGRNDNAVVDSVTDICHFQSIHY